MWLSLAFLSAALLGCYDTLKKIALKDNAVFPVLFFNTFFSSLLFIPLIVLSNQTEVLRDTPFLVGSGGWEMHKYILLKSMLVLSSWILGYFGLKHLPLTIVGPINATRPILVLIGALIVFGERLNGWQWAGVMMAILSYFLLRRSGRKEGIDFKHNRWIYMTIGATILGAISGLYDKFLMAPTDQGGAGLDRMMVQSWFTIYQCIIMGILVAILWWPKHRRTTPFHWSWAIIGVSIFLSAADFMYFYALSVPDALISVVSMVRRGSVLVSFLFGVLLFHEKNLKAKAFDLALMLLGLLFLYIGSK